MLNDVNDVLCYIHLLIQHPNLISLIHVLINELGRHVTISCPKITGVSSHKESRYEVSLSITALCICAPVAKTEGESSIASASHLSCMFKLFTGTDACSCCEGHEICMLRNNQSDFINVCIFLSKLLAPTQNDKHGYSSITTQ